PYIINVGESLDIPLISSGRTGVPAPFSTASQSIPVDTSTSTIYYTTTILLSSTSTRYVTSTSTMTKTNTVTSTHYTTNTLTSTALTWITLTSFSTSAVTSTLTTTATAATTSTVTATSMTTRTATTTSTATSTSTVTTTQYYYNSSDPIATGNPLNDKYDSIVLNAASQYGLDPMILKSQVAQESYFDSQAISPDDPCGQLMQNGVDAGHSYGLMQMTPACISWFARNSDGSIDLSTNSSSLQWSNSAFDPVYNVNSAANDWAVTLQHARQTYRGCSQTQYVEMVLSAYNAGWGSVSGCSTYNVQGARYVSYVLDWYGQFSTMSGWPDPY
ncbi:MAG: transglycosylase SLT domain-containing protein, partial [Rhabdochlamydiaceae bacterium]